MYLKKVYAEVKFWTIAFIWSNNNFIFVFIKLQSFCCINTEPYDTFIDVEQWQLICFLYDITCTLSRWWLSHITCVNHMLFAYINRLSHLCLIPKWVKVSWNKNSTSSGWLYKTHLNCTTMQAMTINYSTYSLLAFNIPYS